MSTQKRGRSVGSGMTPSERKESKNKFKEGRCKLRINIEDRFEWLTPARNKLNLMFTTECWLLSVLSRRPSKGISLTLFFIIIVVKCMKKMCNCQRAFIHFYRHRYATINIKCRWPHLIFFSVSINKPIFIIFNNCKQTCWLPCSPCWCFLLFPRTYANSPQDLIVSVYV